MLSQKQAGEERVIAFARRTLTKSERKVCVSRKELRTVSCFFCETLKTIYAPQADFVEDRPRIFTMVNQFQEPGGTNCPKLKILSSYDMMIEHPPGRLHKKRTP